MKICDECETVAHCAKHGCVPKQQALAQPVQEPVALKPEDVTVEVLTVQSGGGFAPLKTHGVKLTHKPTGIVVQCSSERSQHRNRERALRDLERYLYGARPQPAAQPAPAQESGREAFLAGYEAAQADAKVCHLPPHGWRCTRAAGHDGPCAAVDSPEDAELVASAVKRLREATPPAQPAPVQPVAAPKFFTLGNWFNDLENPHGNR